MCLGCCKNVKQGFKDFLNKRGGNVVDLGVGIIIGGAFSSLVNSFVVDILTPPLGLLFRGSNLVNWFIILRPGEHPDQKYNTPEEAQADGAVTENVGRFLNNLIQFFTLTFALFWIMYGANAIQKEAERIRKLTEGSKDSESSELPCPWCKGSVPKDAYKSSNLQTPTETLIDSLAPVQIFQEEATEERAENARLSSFIGAIAIGDLVKSTLGPKGMDKILQSLTNGEITVTNDGATILKSIALDNAAAKVLVNISKVQDDEVGDGTTSVCVLAAELLREAEKLVSQKIHPQTIIEGYRIASNAAYKALETSIVDNGQNPEEFRKDLFNIARTTLSSKVLSQDKVYFSNLAVDAVLRLKGSTNLEHIQIIKRPGGRLIDSYLDEGFILDKKIGVNQPKRIENARILIANTPMDTDKIKIFGARVRVDSTGKLAELERAERDKMKEKVERIKAHGINCFVNRQLIYNWPESLFAEAGIVSIEHADFDGVERLALVTGSEIASTFDHPELVKLGQCDLIEEIMIGEDKLIKFSGVAAGEACTIVIRGATRQLLDEAERSLHDALSVLTQTIKETGTVLGGGCSEMLMSKAVDEIAAKTPGKKAIAIESFAKALRQIPTILADNGGFDSSDLVAKLRAAHYEGKSTYGLDMIKGEVGDVRELGITESFKLKRQVLTSASEAAEMILRVDDIIRCAPRKRQG
ncbi:7770_t:CDS:10 [Ambispora gerdemannii]|uniref:CCT-beta n=1 Tax=Ambispora gerdemannii TaxID=144530 RepID=A0A9N8YJR6_9GLOM|nr:7770_t:CDS:10 [Ambispora gerdemannii]